MTSSKRQRIAVVGGGVMGLTTARLAQQRGHHVTLFSDQLPLATTSAKAAASFKPHEVVLSDPELRMLRLAWSHFDKLADDPGLRCGVRRHKHWEASSRPLVDYAYLKVVQDLETVDFPDVPGGYRYGRRYTTFFVDMPVFMPWLHSQLVAHGADLVHLRERYRSLEQLAALDYDVVFNCTGLGSRELCQDTSVYPIKGQVAHLAPRPEMDWSISADGFYVYPRRGDTLIGGTAERHVYTETTDEIALSMLVRANRRILPDIEESSILSAAAGLRPFREKGVRVELEIVNERRIIHNYGHGGAGVTLSWGSAELAVELAGV